ncbi:hypothetical protein KUF71_005481, partial [Frankliniella fusca]
WPDQEHRLDMSSTRPNTTTSQSIGDAVVVASERYDTSTDCMGLPPRYRQRATTMKPHSNIQLQTHIPLLATAAALVVDGWAAGASSTLSLLLDRLRVVLVVAKSFTVATSSQRPANKSKQLRGLVDLNKHPGPSVVFLRYNILHKYNAFSSGNVLGKVMSWNIPAHGITQKSPRTISVQWDINTPLSDALQ